MGTVRKRVLMAEPGGGLCNRLICINNAIHLSGEMPDLCICIVWWKEPECACKFEDILKPIAGITVKNYARPLMTRKNLLKRGKVLSVFKACFQKRFFDYYYRRRNRNRIGGFWEGIEGITEKKLISIIETFRPGATIFYRMGVEYRTDCILTENFFSEEVLNKVNNLRNMFCNKKYIGIHIRRTDHRQAIENSSMEFFENAIKKEFEGSEKACFYLATDDCKVEETLRGRYGDCILVNEDGMKGRLSSKAIQDATVDLLMLAGAEKIYGSVGSTFSEMAAKIGNTPLILEL